MLTPADFNVTQINPHPAGSVPAIEYSLPISAKIVLEVYDNSGEKMLTLLNEQKKPGNHTFDFNKVSTDLPHGTYFYRFAAFDDAYHMRYVNVRKLTIYK